MVDRTGLRSGRLVAVRLIGRRGRRLLWECRCDCGKTTNVIGEALASGNTKSCGCLNRDTVIKRNIANSKHGLTKSPEFYVWSGIKQRCYWPRYANYHRYGGRGIKVCDRWRDSFTNFLADMGPRPTPRHQLDRIDNDGDYEPGNCRWASPKEQSDNRSTTVHLTLDGITKPIGFWSKVFGIPSFTILNRIKSGWTPERAVTQPRRAYKNGHC